MKFDVYHLKYFGSLVKKNYFLFLSEEMNEAQQSPNISFKTAEFYHRIVVTLHCTNKILGAPTPSCFAYKQVNAQAYLKHFRGVRN